MAQWLQSRLAQSQLTRQLPRFRPRAAQAEIQLPQVPEVQATRAQEGVVAVAAPLVAEAMLERPVL